MRSPRDRRVVQASPNFVIDSFYKRDAEGERTHDPALSYHIDNGQGLDSVLRWAHSRLRRHRCRMPNGKLIVSKNSHFAGILDNGPIQFSFLVAYAPWDANGVW